MKSTLYSLYKKCIIFILVILVLTNTAPTYAATKLHPNNTTEKIIFSIYRSSSQKILQDKILFYKWKLSMTSDTKQREKIQNILSAFQKIETYKYGNTETYANKKPATLTKNPESTQKSPIQQSNTTTTTSPISINNSPQTGANTTAISGGYSSDWGDGYCYEVTIKNTTTSPINSWEATIYSNQSLNITSSWNFEKIIGTGIMTLKPVTWNAKLNPGESTKVGFCGSGNGRPQNMSVTFSGTTPTVPTSTTTPTPTSTNNSLLTISTTRMNDWGNGFCDTIYVSNPTTADISGWKVTFEFNAAVRGWSGNYVHSGSTQIITPLSWNTVIPAKGKIEFGYCADVTLRPTNYQVISGTTTGTTVTSGNSGNTGTPSTPTSTGTTGNTGTPTTSNPPITLSTTPEFSVPFSIASGKIYDSANKEISLRGVNWFGFETTDGVVHGLWSVGYKESIQQMKQLGFNSVRLPFCPGSLKTTKYPSSINYQINPDLQGKNSLQVMDIIIEELTKNGIYVLLDHHRPDCNAISETPSVSGYSLDDWVNDLVFVATRYKNNPLVFGIDIKNEPHGQARWGNGDITTDWKLQTEKAGSAILAANPNLLIFVEGIETNNDDCHDSLSHWWGGNVEPIVCYPINTTKIPANKLVLSPHVYGPSVYNQEYFRGSDFPGNMPTIWDRHFGRLMNQYAIVVGEFGGKYEGTDKTWQDAFVTYMKNKGVRNFYFWSWNPNSGDTGGILKDDWKTVQQEKYDNLKRLFTY